MPFTPTGTLEVYTVGPGGREEWCWIMDVAGLIAYQAWYINPITDYDLFWTVAGQTKSDAVAKWEKNEYLQPIAPERGLPQDMSSLSQSHWEDCGRTQWETWVLWSELQHLDLDEIHRRTGRQVRMEWCILFDFMAALAKWYPADKVRLILWWAK